MLFPSAFFGWKQRNPSKSGALLLSVSMFPYKIEDRSSREKNVS
jgi:hypothetical protein